METGLWPPTAPPRGAAAALSFVGRRPPDFKLAGASGRGAGHGPPRAPSLGWPSTPVSCQGDLPSEAAGGRRAGRRAASERGARARGQRPRDRFLPLLVHVLSPGWRAHGGASVLDAEVDCSMDVILVGSSELSAPPSPEPCRGEGPPGAKPSLGMPAPGWAALRAPGFWNIPTAFRHLAGPGGPHPETVPWARMIDVPGNAEGLGCRRPRLPGLQKINS